MRRPGPRFTIRSLMIAVAVVAGLLARFLHLPMQLLAALTLVPLYGVLIAVIWGMFYCFRRVAALGFGVVATLADPASAALCIYLLSLAGSVLVLLVWLFTFPIILGAGSG